LGSHLGSGGSLPRLRSHSASSERRNRQCLLFRPATGCAGITPSRANFWTVAGWSSRKSPASQAVTKTSVAPRTSRANRRRESVPFDRSAFCMGSSRAAWELCAPYTARPQQLKPTAGNEPRSCCHSFPPSNLYLLLQIPRPQSCSSATRCRHTGTKLTTYHSGSRAEFDRIPDCTHARLLRTEDPVCAGALFSSRWLPS